MQPILDFSLLLLLLLLPIRTASLKIHGIEDDDEVPWKRRTDFDDGVRQKFVHQTPVGVRKLSDDEGEKFWLDYWQFFDDVAPIGNKAAVEISGPDNRTQSSNDAPDSTADIWQNSSVLQAPYALHGDDLPRSHPRWLPRGLLSFLAKRSFECPVGSSPCTFIDRPNSCCWEGSVCQIIEDTGLGDVGCCPGDSDACDGGLDSCPQGHTSCPENPGGGCCIPGYSCFEVGCISTVTVTVTPSAAPTTSTSTPPPSTTITTATEPAPVDPPWRPTSNPNTSTPTPTPTSTTEPTTTEPPTIPTDVGCPTGFYACSAVYDGGCCRIGRDCQLTSCTARSMTTIVDSDGATIVVPLETSASSSWSAAPTGRCADGWMSCASDDGGGCCPDGYGCGWTSCTASASVGTGSVGKRPPENAGVRGALAEWKFVVVVWMVVVLWQLGW